MRQKQCGAALLFILLFGLSGTVCAQTPYASYDQGKWSAQMAAPNSFVPQYAIDGSQAGSGEWDTPRDMMFDKAGNLYVLDSGHNRVVVLDTALHVQREIVNLKQKNGEKEWFSDPKSIFVAEDNSIYVADTGNSRCLKLDINGNVLKEYQKPDSALYTSETFTPMKIMVDDEGMVYVISQNVYQGIVLFSNDGKFQGYFGSPKVTASAQLLLDRFWKSLFSQEQRSGIAQYVPVEYSSFDRDQKGFVYAVLSYTDNQKEQIRKLNYLGNNILKKTDNFGEKENVSYRRELWYTKFIDVCTENSLIYALDSQWQRVYLFDADGNRLAVFGTSGEQLGAFQEAAALDVYQGKTYVLDAMRANITIFSPTEYGTQILEAVSLYNKGNYTQAVGPWKKVLSMDANNELAYSGIGEAALKAGQYQEAVNNFRLGNNPERESVAFRAYRSQFIRKYIGFFVGVLLLVAGMAVFLTNRRFWSWLMKKKRCHPDKKPQHALLRRALMAVFRPVENLNELKFQRYENKVLVAVVLLVLVMVRILSRQMYGFRFQTYDPDHFSLPIQLAVTLLPLFLFAIANWAVCAIMDGEGKLWEIMTGLAISFIPHIVCTAIAVPLSRVLVLDEKMFLTVLQSVGILWSLMLVFQSQRIVHNYSSGKTLGAAVLTIGGVAIILILVLLLFSLGQQVSYFISTVYKELYFRR